VNSAENSGFFGCQPACHSSILAAALPGLRNARWDPLEREGESLPRIDLVGNPYASFELGLNGLSRKDAWSMLKRRLRDAGLSTIYSNHSFRAAGITNFLENGGNLEVAQRIAGHADSRTTKLYDWRGQKVLVEDMERIRY
jgi:integrase